MSKAAIQQGGQRANLRSGEARKKGELRSPEKLPRKQQHTDASTPEDGEASDVVGEIDNTVPTITRLDLGQISREEEMQPRTQRDQAVVEDYAERRKAGDKFPPVHVFNDGETNWLADGFYRCAAEDLIGGKDIACVVHQGTKEDAQWFALKANKQHGVRLTNDDKKRAIQRALRHPKGIKLSDRQIADHVGVSHATVGKYRGELEMTGRIDQSDRRVGRDGREIDTSNIGRCGSDQQDVANSVTDDGENEAAAEAVGEDVSTSGAEECDADANGEESVADGVDGDGEACDQDAQSPNGEAPHNRESAADRRKRFEKHCALLDKLGGDRLSKKQKALKGALDVHTPKFIKELLETALKRGAKLSSKGACRANGVEAEVIAVGLMQWLEAALKDKAIVDLFAPAENNES